MLFMKGTDDEAKALDCKVQAIFEKASLYEETSGYGQWESSRKGFGFLPLYWNF